MLQTLCNRLLLSLFLITVHNEIAWASESLPYPTKTVKIIVPFAPGGGADYFSRFLAAELTSRMGQTFFVDNRGGAGGSVAVEQAVLAQPDGYTLIFVSNGYAVGPAISNIGYDPLNDFMAISRVVDTSMVVAVNPSVTANDLNALVAFAKQNPMKLAYGSSGVGGISHLATEEFLITNGIEMLHVPYKGTGPANTALLAGDIQINVGDIGAILQMIKAGRIKALAIGSAARSPMLPNVPTAIESGFPNTKLGIWYGLLAPRDTPKAIVLKLNHEVNEILRSPLAIEAFNSRFASPAGGTPEEFKANIEKDFYFWKSFAANNTLTAR